MTLKEHAGVASCIDGHLFHDIVVRRLDAVDDPGVVQAYADRIIVIATFFEMI